MNAEYKTKWLEALRSGHYTQGTSYLRTKEGHCCLGVLCDLMKNEMNGHWDHFGAFVMNNPVEIENTKLPGTISDIVDLHESGLHPSLTYGQLFAVNPAVADRVRAKWNGVKIEGTLVNLTILNDSGLTFHEIADIIEKHY
jgi:hypothetical protein